MSHVYFSDVLFSDTEMDELNNGSTILDGEDELERVWIEYATMYPHVHDVFQLHRIRTLSPSVNRFQAIVLQYCRQNSNVMRRSYMHIGFTMHEAM
jgi:hypothetical protein